MTSYEWVSQWCTIRPLPVSLILQIKFRLEFYVLLQLAMHSIQA